MYRNYKLLKTVRFFGPPCILYCTQLSLVSSELPENRTQLPSKVPDLQTLWSSLLQVMNKSQKKNNYKYMLNDHHIADIHKYIQMYGKFEQLTFTSPHAFYTTILTYYVLSKTIMKNSTR